MARFRIDLVGELARQMAFTPETVRNAQLAAAEKLLLEIDPAKAYPSAFVVYRITAYHRKQADENLLTGLALQHDLGLLIEQVSDSLNLRADDAGQPVLGIEEVTERFNVTSKTLQRWRRRGLAARRFIYADGKRRVGFLPDTLERFLSLHRDQVIRAGNFTEISPIEQQQILRRALRLANQRCTAEEASLRISRKLNRSPLTIAHVLRDHDDVAAQPMFADAPAAFGPDQAVDLLRDYRKGHSLGELAKRTHQPRTAVYRAIVTERLARLNRRKVKFIDDELYHAENAEGSIAEIAAQDDVMASASAAELRAPKDLPPYIAELYRTPLLSLARERSLFLQLHWHKYQFVTARRRLEPQAVRARELTQLEMLRRKIVDCRNRIVRANLRLVVSVARKHLRGGLSIMELISDGNVTLMRTVDSFDFHRGNRFSTYATLALMKGFARSVPEMQSANQQWVRSESVLAGFADIKQSRGAEQWMQQDQIRQLLARLEPRERDVLTAHYGLSQNAPATYEQVGARLGLSKQRVRQIEQSALAKLRTHSSHNTL